MLTFVYYNITVNMRERVTRETAERELKMRTMFYECKYRYQAVKAMPWASVIVHVCGGYMGFESWDDYNIWKNEK